MALILKNEPLTRTDIAFQAPTQVKFGVGKVATLGEELQIEDDLGDLTSVAVITDAALAGLGVVERVRTGLEGSPYEIKVVFDDVPSDSDVRAVEAAARAVTESGAELIIAVGGGSVIDTAKAASVLATHGGRIHDYEGLYMVPGPCMPIVAIPTTCGTGSEVSGGAVVKDHEAKVKVILGSPYVFPRMAVLDPEMLRSLPDRLVAYTGMDAMTHAVEAFVSTDREPFSEALALRAVEMLYDNLPSAVASREDTDALSKVQLAAAMAGIAFTNAVLGATHAIAHSIGSLLGLHHGLSNAVALPYVMEYNLETCPARYAALAVAMGVERAERTEMELAAASVERVRDLNRRMGIPPCYAEIGVASDEALLGEIAEAAMNDPCLAFNPRPTESADMEELVRRCITGAL
jgi:alcohol dehydrogenase class IV